MCCQQSATEKAREAPFFPVGWKFFFQDYNHAEARKTNAVKESKGLVLMAPGGKRYYSVYDAISSNKVLRNKVHKDSFSRYVGLQQQKLCDKKAVGSKCYARCNKNWYPGVITILKRKDKKPFFAVCSDNVVQFCLWNMLVSFCCMICAH